MASERRLRVASPGARPFCRASSTRRCRGRRAGHVRDSATPRDPRLVGVETGRSCYGARAAPALALAEHVAPLAEERRARGRARAGARGRRRAGGVREAERRAARFGAAAHASIPLERDVASSRPPRGGRETPRASAPRRARDVTPHDTLRGADRRRRRREHDACVEAQIQWPRRHRARRRHVRGDRHHLRGARRLVEHGGGRAALRLVGGGVRRR